MKVLYTFPPNYAAINRAFNVRGKPVIFCYGSVIHNPARIKIPERLHAHESVHSARQQAQAGGPAAWWERYITNPQYRLGEEIPAHQAEARCAPELAEEIAARLASPLYGGLVGIEEARRLIAG